MVPWEWPARLVRLLASLLPPCPVRAVLDLPCPSCGTTRAIILLLEGRCGDAFLMNPLVIGGGVLFLGYLIAGWAVYVRTGQFPEPRWTPGRLSILRWAIGVAVVVNWAWLYARGV